MLFSFWCSFFLKVFSLLNDYRCVFLNGASICYAHQKMGSVTCRSLESNHIIRAGEIVWRVRSISWHVFFHDGSIKRLKSNNTSFSIPDHICLIPLSSQKIGNDTFAWANKGRCQDSRAGFCWGGKTQILNFSRWWLPAVTRGRLLRVSPCETVKRTSCLAASRLAPSFQQTSSAGGYLLFGFISFSRTMSCADQNRQWMKKTFVWTWASDVGLCFVHLCAVVKLEWLNSHSLPSWPSLHCRCWRPDFETYVCRWKGCLLSLFVLKWLPIHKRLQSFSTADPHGACSLFHFEGLSLECAVVFKIRCWEEN